MKFILLLITPFLLFSCTCKKTINKDETLSEPKSTNQNTHSGNQKKKYNATKEYFLILKNINGRKNNPFPTVSFSIIDVKNKKVIYKDIIPGGKIVWISDYTIEVKSYLGRPKDIHNSKKWMPLYKLNVKTLKKFK